jgi:pilus assembly protein CpaE
MAGPEKIRVLIVDDIAETRDNLKRMLSFDQGIEVVESGRTGKEAIELSQKLNPDVIIMDINMPDMDGLNATEVLHRKMPAVQVIMLSVQNDTEYMRKAMKAGAYDFLPKPLVLDDLTNAVRSAGEKAREEKSKMVGNFSTGAASSGGINTGSYNEIGKIIVVFSPKGGTGSTTIATNLAIALNTPERKTVLVDGNLQFGDVAIFLNEQSKTNITDLTSRVDDLDPEVVKDVMVTHAASGMHILPAPAKPEHADTIKGDEFGKLLLYLKKLYPFVIVDTASSLTECVQSAMEVMDCMVLITTQEIPSIKNCNLFLNLADQVRISREHIIFVMNRFNPQIGITADKIKESLRQEVVLSIPEDDKIVQNSVNRGVPFVLEFKTSIVGRKIYELANLVIEKMAKIEPEVQAKK